jgi:hypothetical protein
MLQYRIIKSEGMYIVVYNKIPKYPTLYILNKLPVKNNLFLPVLEAGQIKIKVSLDLVFNYRWLPGS